MYLTAHSTSWWGVRSTFGRMLASVLICAFAFFPALNAQAAAPLAGTAIGNQASATYTDAANVTRTVTSNVVTAVVQQVASLTLTQPLDKTVTAGSQVTYPLTLTNTGNGTDSYGLSFAQSGSFSFSSVTFYADANGDGAADNTTPITSTGNLAAGEVFRFVAVANVPTTAVAGNTNALVVTSTSAFNGTVSTTVTDNTTITNNAVLNVTKSMSAVSGNAGSGPYTVTLTYSNTGNTAATSVTLRDALPAGMTYVANSGRWSATGATILTDASAADVQGASPTVIYDFGVTAAGQVTAVINNVAAGQSGILTFQVNVNAGLPTGPLDNTAQYVYNDGAANIGPVSTNTFTFNVNQTVSVSMLGQTVASAVQGSTVTYTNVLTNTGNGVDSFDITVGAGSFPVGTSYTLYKADGVTPMIDTNGNGVPDTGPVGIGATYNVVLKVTLPAGATGGPYSVSKTATSKLDPTKTATATDTLTAIIGNTVDLTNNSSGAAAPGNGAGPEAGAVTTNSTNPASTTRFTLYVNNTSAVGDTFDLAASTDSTFGSLTMPSGWTVVFRDAAETVITNTGVVAGNGNKLVYADVTIPANQAAIPAPGQAVYFRVLSPSSGAIDRKHDAVVINTLRSVQLIPSNTGQVFPGGSVVYAHALTNAGNVAENAGLSTIALSLLETQGTFSSIVYLDINNSNTIDAGDQVINSAAELGAIAAGQTVNLLVKVSAVSGAALGVLNTTTLTATSSGTINGAAAPVAVIVSDATTVIAGNLVLVKEQALDAGCDGTADTAYSTVNISSGAIPNACIRYRVTVTNNGSADVLNVVVSDATPAHTTYDATGPAATSQGGITAPASGAPGTISAAVGTLTPSASAVINFGVRISPL